MKPVKRVLICYVNRSDLGLQNKIKTLVAGFEKEGCMVTQLILQTSGSEMQRLFDWGRIQWSFIKAVLRHQHELIFVRYTYLFLPIYLAALLLKRKMHLEVNSDHRNEFNLNRQVVRSRINALAFHYALKASSCVHVVSRELIEKFQAISPAAKFVYNPNYVVEEYYDPEWNQREAGKVNLVFLGDAGQPWQGIPLFVQKVIVGNNYFIGNAKLHIVGRASKELERVIGQHGLSETVVFQGYLNGAKKAAFMHQMDIGIGVFNLGAKGMKETTSIKVGEYLYAGLPVIIGYIDHSLPPISDFVLKVDLMENDKAVGRINRFIEGVSGNKRIREQAHQYALDNLSVVNYVGRVIEEARKTDEQ